MDNLYEEQNDSTEYKSNNTVVFMLLMSVVLLLGVTTYLVQTNSYTVRDSQAYEYYVETPIPYDQEVSSNKEISDNQGWENIVEIGSQSSRNQESAASWENCYQKDTQLFCK